MAEELKRLDKRLILTITLGGELLVLASSCLWAWIAKIDLPDFLTIKAMSAPLVLLTGAAAALVVSALNLLILYLGNRFGERIFVLRSMKDLIDEMMLPMLGRFTILDSILVAAVSGVAEEVLFRAVLPNQIGRWARMAGLQDVMLAYGLSVGLSALAFGLAHFRNLYFLPYTVWAILVGLLMSFLLYLTGSLQAPIVAHALINLISINILRTIYRRNGEKNAAPR